MWGRNLRVPLISDSDRRVPADWGQESQASSWVEAWNSACLSRCPRGERSLVELYLEPGGLFRTMHGRVTSPAYWLHSRGGIRRGVWASSSYQEGIKYGGLTYAVSTSNQSLAQNRCMGSVCWINTNHVLIMAEAEQLDASLALSIFHLKFQTVVCFIFPK